MMQEAIPIFVNMKRLKKYLKGSLRQYDNKWSWTTLIEEKFRRGRCYSKLSESRKILWMVLWVLSQVLAATIVFLNLKKRKLKGILLFFKLSKEELQATWKTPNHNLVLVNRIIESEIWMFGKLLRTKSLWTL